MTLLDFEVVTQDGHTLDMKSYQASWTLLWFSPIAPAGCTSCTGTLRERLGRFRLLGGAVVGMTYWEPERNFKLHSGPFGYMIPVYQITPQVADAFGVAAEPKPRQAAVLIHDDEQVQRWDPMGRIEDVLAEATLLARPSLMQRLRRK